MVEIIVLYVCLSACLYLKITEIEKILFSENLCQFGTGQEKWREYTET